MILKLIIIIYLKIILCNRLTNNKLNTIQVIGIVSINNPTDDQIIGLSYTNWVKQTGAFVIPINGKKEFDYYKPILEKLSGVLFQGGNQDLTMPCKDDETVVCPTEYSKFISKIIEYAEEINKYRTFGLWGTCLGMQNIILHYSNYQFKFFEQTSLNYSNKIIFINNFDFISKVSIDNLREYDLLYFWHKNATIVEDFQNNNNLNDNFMIYSYYSHKYNNENYLYVNFIKHKKYPFFGIQGHPEGSQYVHNLDLNLSRDSKMMLASFELSMIIKKYFDDKNYFEDYEELNKLLIDNYKIETYNNGLDSRYVVN